MELFAEPVTVRRMLRRVRPKPAPRPARPPRRCRVCNRQGVRTDICGRCRVHADPPPAPPRRRKPRPRKPEFSPIACARCAEPVIDGGLLCRVCRAAREDTT